MIEYERYYKYQDYHISHIGCSTKELADHLDMTVEDFIKWLPIKDIIQVEEQQRLRWEIEGMYRD